MMRTLKDLREYAERKGMSEYDIERLIDETETDGNGNIIDNYEAICLSINCEFEPLCKVKNICCNKS